MKPSHPLYIVSKGRADTQLTTGYLAEMGVRHHIVVEEQEYDAYRAVANEFAQVVVLDGKFKAEYDTCIADKSKSTGSGPARNFAWEHSLSLGASWHWVMDDNIDGFYRLYRNIKTPCRSASFFRCMEDFCARFENVMMGGPNYFMFASRKSKMPPFVLNTRIYSCNLIRNDLPFRWRGRYNEDTDLSLRILKSGLCTVLFNAFLQMKATTQTMKGGNTDEFYAEEGTLPKSQMLADLHPGTVKVVHKFGRWHHHVDYSAFRQQPVHREGVKIKDGVDNYGMVLQDLVDGEWVTRRER